MRSCGLRAVVVPFVIFGVVLVAGISPALGSDECLVEFQDQTGSLADGTTLTQTATRKKCAFSLRLCTNAAQAGCPLATFQTKRFRASGHCGPVGKLQVVASGGGSVCGAFTGVTVSTKGNGRKEGRCAISASVRSARTRARHDLDHLTLVCQP